MSASLRCDGCGKMIDGAEVATPRMTTHDLKPDNRPAASAIDPTGGFIPDPDSPPWKTLRPVTLALQFGNVSEFQAKTILDLFAERIVRGQLSPEPGGFHIEGTGLSKEAWRQLLSATLACMSEGKHTGEEKSDG